MQTPIVGIDVGTTNSVIALAENGTATAIRNKRGMRTTPSVVAFDDNKAVVGKRAAELAAQQPDETIGSFKRFIGTEEIIHFGSATHGFTPEEAAACLLKTLKRDAEREVGHRIERSVLTVPAHFTARQRRAMKHTGEIAGLVVDRIIDEPTAASLVYGLQTGNDGTVLVYDLGGGAFDVSLVDINDCVFEVIATDGDPRLGGDDWDAAIVDWLDMQIEHAYDIRLEENPIANERLFESAQTAKHDLSEHTSTTLTIPALEHEGTSYDIKQRLHRDQLERITRGFVTGTLSICENLLEAAGAGYRPETIDEILLLGRATRMPFVRERISEYFGQSPSERIDPDTAVAIGATAQAAIIHDDQLPVSPPEDDAERITTNDVVVLDVAPHSLRVKSTEPKQSDEHFDTLVPDNSPLPTHATDVLTTAYDRQKQMLVPIYFERRSTTEIDGERSRDGTRNVDRNGNKNKNMERNIIENELLDEFKIGPIPPRQAGVPTIEIEFELDRNGILQTTIADLDPESGEVAIETESVFDFTRSELDTMKRELPVI